MSARPIAVAGLALLSVAGLSACQSTQDKSSDLSKRGSTTLLAEKGLAISKRSTDVKVTSTTVLTDENGSAVVVGLHNDSSQSLTGVPISIDVLDAKGKSVYKNDIPGIEPALASVPYIPAGGDANWIDDQVYATSKPESVKVEVGARSDSFSGERPQIQVSPPKLEGDPVSGVDAAGNVVNQTGEDQGRLLLYAVATEGGRIVAAGRGAIDHLKAAGKPVPYHIYFIGNPTGAKIYISRFPALPGAK